MRRSTVRNIAIFTIVLVLCGTSLSAQDEQPPPPRAPQGLAQQIDRYLGTLPEFRGVVHMEEGAPFPIPKEILEDDQFAFERRMALSGHGLLYDSSGNLVDLGVEEGFELQRQLLNGVRREAEGRDGPETGGQELGQLIDELSGVLESQEFEASERFVLEHLLIRAWAERLSGIRRDEYAWRTIHLMDRVLPLIDSRVTQRPLFVEFDNRLTEWFREWVARVGEYVAQCTLAGVPIPPDFATTGTPWTRQGDINDITPAEIWTWAPPNSRGACVALPRGDGGPGSLNGIICQSAATGNACFWDNLPIGASTRIPWRTETMVIAELQNGSDLAQNCTSCHKGNNVFLVYPDHPTFCRLLRGGRGCPTLDGADSANFTLAVEGAVRQVEIKNHSLQHPRYTPLSGVPARATWRNDAAVGCGGQCHLAGTSITPPMMPPLCGTDCW